MEDFLRKLYNNNHPGYFHLDQNPQSGISDPHVAFLTLSVSLRNEHYAKCLKERVAQLTEIFQAKLGWLVGNMYSRVGTPDWVPSQLSEDDFTSMIKSNLDRMCLWTNKKAVEYLKQEQKRRRVTEGADYVLPPEDITTLLDAFATAREARKDIVISHVISQIRGTISTVSAGELQRLQNRLTNSPELARILN